MATEKLESATPEESHKDAAVKADTETLKTTDPQEHMEGPVSSILQKLENAFNSKQTREEAQKERDDKM